MRGRSDASLPAHEQHDAGAACVSADVQPAEPVWVPALLPSASLSLASFLPSIASSPFCPAALSPWLSLPRQLSDLATTRRDR